jgi:beta-glucosidase/6-phospho-beta-glucosidase/beta-galactosidase
VRVKGYVQRGTMDNCEWTAGFGNRFGFVYVDFSRKNTPKLSAARFREAAVRNAVV